MVFVPAFALSFGGSILELRVATNIGPWKRMRNDDCSEKLGTYEVK